MLVKLTAGVVAVVVERVSDASNQVEGVGGGVKVRVEDVDQACKTGGPFACFFAARIGIYIYQN